MTASPQRQAGELVALVREGRVAAFLDRAWTLPPADLADVLLDLPPDLRHRTLTQLPPQLGAPALVEMSRDAHPEALLVAAGSARAAELVACLDDDDAASILGRLDHTSRQAILNLLVDRSALDGLLAQQPGTAGALMTARMVTVSELDTMALANEAVRRQAAALGELAAIFVTDTARRLVGVLPIKELLLAPGTSLVRDSMQRMPVHVGAREAQDLVARVLARYSLSSIPVVDGAGRLIGQITADDVRGVAIDEATEDLLRFGGVSHREAIDAGWSLAVRSRLPWLYATLLPAFGAAAVVLFFKGTLLRVVSLAIWMPVVAGVGGNAGTQSLAIAVRRAVLHPSRGTGLRRAVLREAAIGATNGLAMGIVIAAVAVLAGESWKLGFVVGLAMVANLAVAGIAGAAIPVALKRMGRDPALASPVIVTVLMDACGLAILLSIASLLLR